ncbi:MAG: flavodoxin-dependent (E)-4-hydroxy-3-methylbut-2-enyl-diphosphate synthase [Candidatus Omnitrophota bacterium]
MKISRRKTRSVRVGNVYIGGNNPVVIQSMTKTKTRDAENTLRQIRQLEGAGCEIVRLAVKDKSDAVALKKIKARVNIPLVADIHFDWRLALEAIDSGIDKIRLNPGNIHKREQIRQIAKAAKLNRIPIRVGLNSGSLPKGKKAANVAQAMVKGALDYIGVIEKCGFYDIVVSLKASSVLDTIEAYRKMAGVCDYPFHLGVTATGSPYLGLAKSSAALSTLLLEGIGDTIRISLTDKPEAEVRAAKAILEAVQLRHFGPEVISCPTCGRCEVDLIRIVKDLENKLSTIDYRLQTRPMKLAVMGCVVNGPGEAKEADLGVAFGKKEGLLFKKGKPVRKISVSKCADVLLKELLKY